jgi:tetratricopeptide (TPR) repeat protein
MKRCGVSLTLIVLFLSFAVSAPPASAQIDRITIAAGSDEDHALQTISSEQDPQKKLAMYEDFVQKFSSNAPAAAYGNWQISQAYQASGDLEKSLDYGDKALAGSPHNLDILVSQAGVAQRGHERRGLCPPAERTKICRTERLRFSGVLGFQRHHERNRPKEPHG